MSPPNTWRSAVDQLLLGSAVADTRHELTLGAVPTVSVEGADVTLAGHLAEMITLLERASRETTRDRPFSQWRTFLLDLTLDALAVPTDDRWQRLEFESIIEDLADRSRFGGAEGPEGMDEPNLRFADLVGVVSEHLEGSPSRSAFRPGSLTFTSLPALRSVPRRVVCLLGFDDAAFAAPPTDGDDLSMLSPRLGDPEGRNDERQVLLEAALSATERLIITRTGHDVVRNHEVQEAVPLAELWDVVAQTLTAESAGSMRSRLEFRHTRHGFDEANFWSDAQSG